MNMETITFITSNKSKAEQLSRYLKLPLKHQSVEIEELQSLDPKKVVEHKARQAYKAIGTPVVVDDVSLVIHTLGRLPGPFIKFFLMEMGTEGICKLLDKYKDRSATASVMLGFYDGKEFKSFEASLDGSIAKSPKGQNGFGWNFIFIPKGLKKTYAELQGKAHDKVSIRLKAVKKLERFLLKKYAN